MKENWTRFSPNKETKKQLRKTIYTPFTTRGFTLVELLVAMTIATILFAIAWKFLDNTANASREITSKSETIDDARVALQNLTDVLQNVDAYASPDSSNDPRVKPVRPNVGKVTGLYPYPASEGRFIWNDSGNKPTLVGPSSPIYTRNPQAIFDGFVVLGAFSYPLSFDTRINNLSASQLKVPDTPRGASRLRVIHPFIVPTDNNSGSAPSVVSNVSQWKTRLLRILDAEGYKQFSAITNVDPSNNTIQLTTPLSAKRSGSSFGVDVAIGAQDRYYSTSALDLYWYRIRLDPNPSTPHNIQLVRDRLCARTALPAYNTNPTNFHPEDHLPDLQDCGNRETVVLANNIASFDFWVDCGTEIAGTKKAPMTNNQILRRVNRRGIISDTRCYDFSNSNARSYLPRIIHIRLSTYTSTERAAITDPNYFYRNNRLVAFDANPDYNGASIVTTLQTDIFMRNFLYW